MTQQEMHENIIGCLHECEKEEQEAGVMNMGTSTETMKYAGLPWTAGDDAALLREINWGWGVDDAARYLFRTEQEVQNRLDHLTKAAA